MFLTCRKPSHTCSHCCLKLRRETCAQFLCYTYSHCCFVFSHSDIGAYITATAVTTYYSPQSQQPLPLLSDNHCCRFYTHTECTHSACHLLTEHRVGLLMILHADQEDWLINHLVLQPSKRITIWSLRYFTPNALVPMSASFACAIAGWLSSYIRVGLCNTKPTSLNRFLNPTTSLLTKNSSESSAPVVYVSIVVWCFSELS